MGTLDGKVVLVTGASQGMGASHVRAVVDAGASVVIADVDAGRGEALAAELESKAVFVPLDVTSTQSWNAAIKATVSAFGGLDVLVNNAGILRTNPVVETSDVEWDLVLKVNLTGTFKGIRAAAPEMAKRGSTSIINISSTAGLKGFAGSSAYISSKWAVRGLTKAAALELASQGTRVNSIHPGNIKTQMIDGLYEDYPHVAQGRAGEPQEISALVVFLASDSSSFSTGSEFVADGGETAGLPALW